MQWKEITEEWYYHMLCVLPPIYGNKQGLFAVDEPVNHTRQGVPVYAIFDERDGKYWEALGTEAQMRSA